MRSLVHRAYARLRPLLHRMGVLAFARKLLSDRTRTQIAVRLGLGGFGIQTHTGYQLPQRTKVDPATVNGVNFIGNTEAVLGITEAARQLIMAIETASIPHQVVPLPDLSMQIPENHQRFTDADAPYSANLMHVNPQEVPFVVQHYLEDIVTEKYLIAYWHWELATFPAKWHEMTHFFDEIWVASHFIREAIQNTTSTPVVRVPLPVTAISPRHSRAELGLPADKFLFLCIFSPGSNIARKNPFGVIDAFERAFAKQASHNAVLVVKTHHLDSIYGEHVREPLREAVQRVGGILIEDSVSKAKMHSLIANVDCLVSLHRAEGFGLTIAEAMSHGKPVIVTRYAGSMDFTTPETAYLVNCTLRQINEDDHRFFPDMSQIYHVGEWWAEPDVDHAARQMRYVYEHSQDAHQIGQQAQALIVQDFSHAAVGEIIADRLRITAADRT
ncbi:MAG: glycosyltransferase family 4 protein [Chloroflexota bacterium]